MKTLIFLYPDQFEKLERGEAIEVSFPIKHFWTKRILNWAAKSDESNSNIA